MKKTLITKDDFKNKLKELNKLILDAIKKENYHIAAELCSKAYDIKKKLKE